MISLTNLCTGGGCACKLDAQNLKSLLTATKIRPSEKLLIGSETQDDAAVYKISEQQLLLFTTDFLTPIVDDPRKFGSIAAAHALSDIYAMGGTPLLANAILGFPPDLIPAAVIQEIIQGGNEVMEKQKCVIAGGHTIKNPQPIYGFSVIGSTSPHELKLNSTAQENDILFLTKPLGVGVLSSAAKIGLYEPAEDFLRNLLEVNSLGSQLGQWKDVHAMTDLTGFGLIGHLLEMIQGGLLGINLFSSHIECLSGALDLLDAVSSPESGLQNNYRNQSPFVSYDSSIDERVRKVYSDPQTNGGLLIAVKETQAQSLANFMEQELCRKIHPIGQFIRKPNDLSPIHVKA